MKVTVSARSPDADWDDFAEAAPGAVFSHRRAWFRSVEEGMGRKTHFIEARADEGALLGILPLTDIPSHLFGHSLVSNGFCVRGGPLAITPAVHDALDGAAREVAVKTGAHHVVYRSLSRSRPGWPAESGRYAYFSKRLPEDPDAILPSIPRKQRAEIRKAMSLDLAVDHDGDADTFYTLLARSWRAHGTPILPRRFFHALKRNFGTDCEITTVRSYGKPIASLLSFYFRGRVFPYYAGSGDGARAASAHHLMYYALMLRAHARGARRFDFGRSRVGTGAYAFKRGFGFEPEPLVSEYMLMKDGRLPQADPGNPRYRFFIASWKRLPLGIANLAGPLIARDLG